MFPPEDSSQDRGIRPAGRIGDQGAWDAASAQRIGDEARQGRLARERDRAEQELDYAERRRPVCDIVVTPDGRASVRRGRDGVVIIDLTEKRAPTQGGFASSSATIPWQLEGFVDSGATKIRIVPGMVNNFVPTIGGTSLVAYPAPALTVTGSSGLVYLKATVDAAGAITALEIASASSVPADTSTLKHKLVGGWTASGGAFTSVSSVLNTNQTFRICNGAAEWY